MQTSHAKDGLIALGQFTFKVFEPGTQILKREFSFPNLVVNQGLQHVLRCFAELETISPLDVLQIGTGTTAVDPSDTALETLVASVDRSLREVSPGELLLTFYVPDALLPEQEYTEVGIRIDGEDGPLFSHALLSPTYDKSVAEDLVVEYLLTLANA
jgi:hypothetical protein